MNTKYSKKRINKKGFTLIELLAVIVILAILVMLAIPAVTRYLTAARQGAFSDNAHRAIDAVRTDVITKGFYQTSKTGITCKNATCTYTLDAINPLLERELKNSPFGPEYDCAIVTVAQTEGTNGQANYTYTMTLIDKGKNGFKDKDEKAINSDAIELNKSSLTCPDATAQTPEEGSGTGTGA